MVRTRNGFGERLGNNTSDDPDGDGEADEGILYQKIYIKILYKNLSLYWQTIFNQKYFYTLCQMKMRKKETVVRPR